MAARSSADYHGHIMRKCKLRHQLSVACVLIGIVGIHFTEQAEARPREETASGLDLDLIRAVKAGNSKAVETLLESGADASARQGDGASALHWAIHRDDFDLARQLIEAGADVNAGDDHNVTPLSLASLNGSRAATSLLLEAGADVNLSRMSGETPLMTAARVGSIEVVRLLLEGGADLNAAEHARQQTSLMWAIAESHTAVSQLLVEVGASVSARTTLGFTPLLFAAQQGNLDAVQLLLAAGADVNDSAPDGIGGDTNARVRYRPGTDAHALLVAIDSGHAEMALYLLERGADANHDGAGRAALHAAVQQRMPEVVSALLSRGANADARLTRSLPLVSRRIRLDNGLAPTRNGATAFWLAASYADLEIMRLLIDGGADPDLMSDDGTTALMVAAGADFVEGQDKYGRRWFGDAGPLQQAAIKAIAMCLELGADINATNHNGQTPLHGAVYLGGTIVVPYLVARGAETDAINRRGQTAWMIAAQGEYRAGSFYTHEETGDVLERLGADMTIGFDLGKDFRKVLDQPEEELAAVADGPSGSSPTASPATSPTTR